jgi:alkylation response protein AidB-like acyl-CoA dehydrogenase
MALNSEQELIKQTALSFAHQELRPFANEWDEAHFFPVETMQKAAELGFGSLFIADQDGGAGLSRMDGVLVFEALAQGCVSTSAFLSIHNMVAAMIARFGSQAQKTEFLPDLISMKTLASYCLTEPSSGSDAASLKTAAQKVNGGYVLTGSKSFISGAGVSGIYVVMARTGGVGAKGVTAFIVPLGTEGFSFGANEKKMGWRSQPTRQVHLDQVFVPESSVLGEVGQGFKFAMIGLDGGRLNIAACALGGAQDALDRALDYTGQRQQFGKALNTFQVSQFKLADMETELQAARCLLYEAAQRLDSQDAEASKWCAMAKRFVTDMAFDVANQALQLHGGYGYLADYGIERIVRDLRVHQILEGTNEVMRMIIARQMIGSAL